MPRIYKPGAVTSSDNVVLIPDAAPPPPPPRPQAKEGGEVPTGPSPEEQRLSQELYESVFQQAKTDGEQMSQRLMDMARTERDVILTQTRQDAEEIRRQARAEGQEQGRTESIEAIRAGLNQMDQCLMELRERQETFLADYAREVQNFALEIASKVLSKKITENDVMMGELVKTAIDSIRDADWITVELSDKLPRLISFLQSELKGDRREKGAVEIVAKDLPVDACILKTPDGNVDASVSTQLQNLKDFFKHA